MLDVGQEANHVTRKPSKLSYKSSAGRKHSVGVIKPLSFCRGFEAGNHAAAEMAAGLATAFTSPLPAGMSPISQFLTQPPCWLVLLIIVFLIVPREAVPAGVEGGWVGGGVNLPQQTQVT